MRFDPVHLESVLPVDAAQAAIFDGLEPRRSRFRVEYSHVAGAVWTGHVELRAYRWPGGNRPRPTLTGQFTATPSGCRLDGEMKASEIEGLLLAVVGAVLGLTVFGRGVIGLVTSFLHGGWARGTHWLPPIIMPLVLAGFAAAMWTYFRRLARDDEQYLRRWVTDRLDSDVYQRQ
jgi:hypothetical protein